MRKVISTLLLVLLTLGCSGRDWLAKIYMVKAENAHARAYELRINKALQEERQTLYEKACSYFSKAHQANPGVFTLVRIEAAVDSCTRVHDAEDEEKFRQFQDRYIREHPTEAKYGDAFPMQLE